MSYRCRPLPFFVLLLAAFVTPLAASRLPPEPPAPTPPEAAPWTAHPAERSDADRAATQAGNARSVVRVIDLEPLLARRGGSPRFHVQGQLHQAGSRPASGPESGLPRAPSAGHGDRPTPQLGAEAAGDLLESFDGIRYAQSGWIPPDTQLAVGASHVMEATNADFAVYGKDGGTIQAPTGLETLFADLLPGDWGGILFDPRVVYDAGRNRFVLLVLGKDDVRQTSYFFVAVSQTSDPSGIWWIYRIVANDTGGSGADADAWADYAGLGVDDWGLYITTNLFRWTGGFKYAALHAFGPSILQGGSWSSTRFWDLRWPDGSQAFGLQAAHPQSRAGDAATFFVNTYSASGSSVCLWKLTGNRTNGPSLGRSAIAVPGYDMIGENVDQPGSSADIDGGDTRIMNAVYANRRVWTTWTTDPLDDGSSAAVDVVQLDVDAKSLLRNRRVRNTGYYYFYPALTVAGSDADARVAVYLSYSSASDYVSTAVISLAGDLQESLAFPAFRLGQGPYERRDGGGRNRWGDYSGAGWDWQRQTAWARPNGPVSATSGGRRSPSSICSATGEAVGGEAVVAAAVVEVVGGPASPTATPSASSATAFGWRSTGIPAATRASATSYPAAATTRPTSGSSATTIGRCW